MASSLGNLVGVIGGMKKGRQGKLMMRKAQEYIDNFEYDELTNSYDNLSVSTLGADLQREELGRSTATSVDALRSGGVRGVVGGIGKINAQNMFANSRIAANLDQQQKAIDYAQANDQSVIRGMQERRQTEELQGYGQMLNVGMQLKYGAYADIMNAGQQQGQTNMAIMDRVMGGMSGGMGGGGQSSAPAPSVPYGTGMQGFSQDPNWSPAGGRGY